MQRRDQQRFSCSIFSQANDITKTVIIWFFDTAQVTKLICFKFWSTFSSFVAWTFKIISKNAVFAAIFQSFEKINIFISTRNAILMTTSCVFITFWLRYHNLLISSTCVNIKADSPPKTQDFRAKKASADWGLVFFETELFSAYVFHVFWISPEKRQNAEKALFSADYLSYFNPGCVFRIKCIQMLNLNPNRNSGILPGNSRI